MMERRPRYRGACLAVEALCCLWAAEASSVDQRGEYSLSEAYVDEEFFSRFDFWVDEDPTKGFVDYVNEADARRLGLAKAMSDLAYMGAEHSMNSSDAGRPSVRIQSKKVYNEGLFIANIDHIPTGCGTWPAFWMYGADAQHSWPRWGEYDIVEGVHEDKESKTTLHTTDKCDQKEIVPGYDFKTEWDLGASPGVEANNCDVHAPQQWTNQGCSQRGPPGSMGKGFNTQGGGTFAAEWDPVAQHFRTWFWPKGKEPRDVAQRRPEPHTWGMPYSFFSLKKEVCSTRHFQNMRLVFDLTFCGDLGDALWSSSCSAYGPSCAAHVKNNPQNFTEAYWSIRRLDVYTRHLDKHGVVVASTSSKEPPVTTTPTTRPTTSSSAQITVPVFHNPETTTSSKAHVHTTTTTTTPNHVIIIADEDDSGKATPAPSPGVEGPVITPPIVVTESPSTGPHLRIKGHGLPLHWAKTVSKPEALACLLALIPVAILAVLLRNKQIPTLAGSRKVSRKVLCLAESCQCQGAGPASCYECAPASAPGSPSNLSSPPGSPAETIEYCGQDSANLQRWRAPGRNNDPYCLGGSPPPPSTSTTEGLGDVPPLPHAGSSASHLGSARGPVFLQPSQDRDRNPQNSGRAQYPQPAPSPNSREQWEQQLRQQQLHLQQQVQQRQQQQHQHQQQQMMYLQQQSMSPTPAAALGGDPGSALVRCGSAPIIHSSPSFLEQSPLRTGGSMQLPPTTQMGAQVWMGGSAVSASPHHSGALTARSLQHSPVRAWPGEVQPQLARPLSQPDLASPVMGHRRHLEFPPPPTFTQHRGQSPRGHASAAVLPVNYPVAPPSVDPSGCSSVATVPGGGNTQSPYLSSRSVSSYAESSPPSQTRGVSVNASVSGGSSGASSVAAPGSAR